MTHGFSTRAIHSGQDFDPTTGAVVPPIYQSSTFVQDGIGGFRGGYEYARSANPTRDSLQTLLADLEGGSHAFSFASGLAAEDALLRSVLRPGSRIVMGNDVYGGTHRLVNRLHVPWGVVLETVEMTDLDAVRAAVRPGETAVLWVETPATPDEDQRRHGARRDRPRRGRARRRRQHLRVALPAAAPVARGRRRRALDDQVHRRAPDVVGERSSSTTRRSPTRSGSSSSARARCRRPWRPG